jgi:hypothetical protein
MPGMLPVNVSVPAALLTSSWAPDKECQELAFASHSQTPALI